MIGWIRESWAGLVLGGLALVITGQALEVLPLGSPQQWERIELRVTGIPSSPNPFDPDQVRVDATFRAPSGQQMSVPGFWHREYARRLENGNEVLSAAEPPEWRLRFLPTETGLHLANVTARLNGSQDGETVATSFEVPASTNGPPRRGYVRIAANNRYFETGDGQPLPLIGQCVCWHQSRGTYDYDDWFGAMAGAGENYTRLWMAPWAFGIEAEPGTGVKYRLDRAWQLDHVLELAEQRGIYLMLCFDYHGMFETQPDFWGANNNWKLNPYNAANGGPCANQNEFFTKPEARNLYQKRLRYLIARYGYSPNLLAWQFFNEIDNVYRYLNSADVAAWHAAMGDWLKANDPWKHLVTTSLTGSSDRPEIWRLPQMELAMYHSYAQAEPASVLPGIVHRFLRDYNKPMMIGEFGTDWRGWRREQDPYLRGWRQGLWAGALSGSVGNSMSWWWENVHSEGLYPTYRAMHDFLDPAGWGKGVWQIVEFTTDGEPPATVGEAVPGGAPFHVTLPLSSAWGAVLKGELAVANTDATSQSAGALNSFVHGTAHPDLRTPFKLSAWLTNSARLIMHMNSVSGGAILAVRVDGTEVFRKSLPNKDGGWEVNAEYDEDVVVDLTAGKHLIEIRNAGSDWFYLDWVRIENVLPSAYANGWQPSPVATGLRGERETLLYVVNPRASYPANATNAVIEPMIGGAVKLEGLPAGRYRAVWHDPKTAMRTGETTGSSDGAVLVLPLPEFSEDLAGRVQRVADFSLEFPMRQPDGAFEARLDGDPTSVYGVETSGDLGNWRDIEGVGSVAGGSAFRDATASAAPRRFYRARLAE